MELGIKVVLTLFSVAALMFIFGANQDAYAVSFFTDRPSWEAAVGAAQITNDPFDNDIADADVIVFDSGVVSTGFNDGGNGLNEVLNGVYQAESDKDGINGYETITWDFPNPIIGFGGDFGTACSGEFLLIISNFEGGGDMTVNLVDHLGTPCNGFFGIVSSSSFQSIRYTSNDGGQASFEFWVMNNLSFTTLGVVGGEIIPIDTTALLLAGTQMNAAWMIPVIVSGIGFAIVIARKF